MNKQNSYSGIDFFRLIAALLIIAIHTSPLASFSETGDFILTRILARVAVPFFFITSGFFLVSKYNNSSQRLASFVKKTALIYGAATLLYIPINIFIGYFHTDYLFYNIFKDIIFDGTFYHLWYLPASILGAVIAYYSVKKLTYPKAFVIASLLYLIGLFGDSYYGVSLNIGTLSDFYSVLFRFFDYTRNGIFFAPIFFVMGGFIADRKKTLSLKTSTLGFALSLAFMLAEALTLHIFNLRRHDSMYVFLIPTMYCLFNILLHFKGRRHTSLRTISLIVYIVHPLMIIALRGFAKFTNLQKLLIDNSLINYFSVCIASILVGVALNMLLNKFKFKSKTYDSSEDRAFLELNLKNLEHNVHVLQNAMPSECELMAVVKADAYGHGMYETATYLEKTGVKAFAVATIDEGIQLRMCGVTGEILILGYTSPHRAKELKKFELTQTLTDYNYMLMLNEQGYKIKAHIKIDTGMHRLGFSADETLNVLYAFTMENIKITGVYTHLCCADSLKQSDVEFTRNQISSFYSLINFLKEKGVKIPKLHIQSSYGLLNYPELKCDYVRAGIALYGVLSSPHDHTRLHLDLKPVLSLKARVVLIRNIKKGENVGYGRMFTADKDRKIAILPIGYADGYPRSLSSKNTYVLIDGQRAPVVGKICMDQLAVDVTDVSNVCIGSVATLIGKDKDDEITAPMTAENTESITNELMSRMGQRLSVVRI